MYAASASVSPAPGEEGEKGHYPEHQQHDEEHGDVEEDGVLVEARYRDDRVAVRVGARHWVGGKETPKHPRKMLRRSC